MKKFFLVASIFLAIFLMRPFDAFALESVLYFSDITSGPKTGLGDGKGSGVIVTVWGVNLGSSQGTSTISVGGVPASYVYYWGNADTTGASGPADLYTSHKMQTISFSVPAAAADGANTISVTVKGVPTNTLPFTVRPGRIFWIKTTGTNSSASGSWSSPWQTIPYALRAASSGGPGVVAGDTIYVADNVTESGGAIVYYLNGTAAAPISLIAYPGVRATILSVGGGWAFTPHDHASVYWNISKITIKTTQIGVGTFRGMRAVGTEITNYPGGCAGIGGQSGAIAGNNYRDTRDTVGGGMKFFGNYIHDFGCDATSKLHHVFYISNRGGTSQQSFELGWNYLINNKAYHALHVYDEGICGDFTGPMEMHDNVVVNQTGVGFGVNSGGSSTHCFTMPVNVYNNLFVNLGLGTHANAIGIAGWNNHSTIKVYNNTFAGFGDPTSSDTAFFSDMNAGSGGVFPGHWEMVNNIIVNSKDVPYVATSNAFTPPQVHSNNLWYNPSRAIPTPSWDTAPLTSDPGFVDSANGFYNLTQGSGARGTGADTSPITIRDLRGIKRGLGTPYSIGAFEFISNKMPSAPQLQTIE